MVPNDSETTPSFDAPLSGRLDQQSDRDAATARQRFGRAQARMALGRDAGAREDLLGLAGEWDDATRLELAYLDLRERGEVQKTIRTAQEIAGRASDDPRLRARALHVLGMALDRARQKGQALARLLEAARLYDEEGNDIARAHVYDTIGTLHATSGRLDQATHYYALSLVDKALLGDRRGLAVTIGNLGRVQLRAGRFQDAVRYFERDLALAEELGDARARARMHEDLGRAYAGLGDFERAETHYQTALRESADGAFHELAFYAHVDLAVLHLRRGDTARAREELEEARSLELGDVSAYRDALLDAVRGALLLAEGNERGVDVLRRAVDGLSAADAPDHAIPARIQLARAYADRGLSALAEKVLLEGIRKARQGHPRYLPDLNEAMAALEVVEPALEETPRRRTPSGTVPADGAYVILGKLGEGATSEVFRAYDPRHAREVALKALRLERLYELPKRKRLLRSARAEIEAASRVRHPGIARVYAMGIEDDGGVYVTQEYVPGRPLRDVMVAEPSPSAHRVAAFAAPLAHALAAIHEAGIAHRDVKPENIIVREDGQPVLVDFGIARLLEDAPDGTFAGSVSYAAPEMFGEAHVDARADLHALGQILFEWLVGFTPSRAEGRSMADVMRTKLEEDAPRVSEFVPDIDPELDDLIASLLERDPANRPPRTEAVAAALESIRDRLGP